MAELNPLSRETAGLLVTLLETGVVRRLQLELALAARLLFADRLTKVLPTQIVLPEAQSGAFLQYFKPTDDDPVAWRLTGTREYVLPLEQKMDVLEINHACNATEDKINLLESLLNDTPKSLYNDSAFDRAPLS